MTRVLLLTLFLFSGMVSAAQEEDLDPTELYIIGLCHNTAAFVEQIAVERDKGWPAEAIQNTLLKRAETNKGLTTSELVFGFLLVEMIYDRKSIAPAELRQATYLNCIKTYTRSFYEQ